MSRKLNKPWASALMLAVNRMVNSKDEDGKPIRVRALALLAERVINAAIMGDMLAAREIGNRLDGKPVESHELSGPDGGPIETIDAAKVRDKVLELFAAEKIVPAETENPNTVH